MLNFREHIGEGGNVIFDVKLLGSHEGKAGLVGGLGEGLVRGAESWQQEDNDDISALVPGY